MNPQTIARQTRFRQFVYGFNMNQITEKQPLSEVLKRGLNIVFVETMEQAKTIKGMCDAVYIPVGTYVDFKDCAQMLKAWHRQAVKRTFACMVVHQSTCTGWYAHADNLIWIGEPYDANTPEYAQASLRIRGKTVNPAIYTKDELL